MSVLTVKVPDDSVDFVEEFIEGNVEEKNKEKKLVKKSNKKEVCYLSDNCI